MAFFVRERQALKGRALDEFVFRLAQYMAMFCQRIRMVFFRRRGVL